METRLAQVKANLPVLCPAKCTARGLAAARGTAYRPWTHRIHCGNSHFEGMQKAFIKRFIPIILLGFERSWA